jgi:hypothetical protein
MAHILLQSKRRSHYFKHRHPCQSITDLGAFYKHGTVFGGSLISLSGKNRGF